MRNAREAIVISGLLAATALMALILIAPYLRVPDEPILDIPQPAELIQLPRAEGARLKTYANQDVGFSVRHPETVRPTEDASDMRRSGYIPVCDPDFAIACFPYPKEAYSGTNFSGAAFAVHLRPDLKTEAVCGRARPGEAPDGETNINGVTYTKFAFGDAAASHRLDGENYRAFRGGNCYELSTRVLTTVFEVYEPGMIARFSDDDRAAVQSVLDAMLMSFRFIVGS